jgi:hypothetical protein
MLRIFVYRFNGKLLFTIVLLFYWLLSTLLYGADNNSIVLSTNELSEEIRAKLESNALALNPISLVWIKQKKSNLNEKQLSDAINTPYDYGILEQSACVFMWQDKRGYYSETCKNSVDLQGRDEKKLPFLSDKDIEKKLSIQERSFNGEIFCAGLGYGLDHATPGLGVYSLKQLQDRPLMNTLYQRYTMKFGYKFPNIGRELGMQQQSYILFLNDNGTLIKVENQSINKKNMIQIVVKGYDFWEQRDRLFDFCLDPEYGYAVSNCIIKTIDEKIAYSIKNEQFEKIPQKEIYIPRKTIVQYFTDATIPDKISTAPLFTEEYLLTEISTKKISDKQFDLRTKYTAPGTHISDRTLMDTLEGVQYVLPANPADLDRVIEAALTGKDFVPTPLPSMAAIVIKWLLCIAGIAMILYAAYKKFVKNKSE